MSLDERELKKLWDEELDKEERKIVAAMATVVNCLGNIKNPNETPHNTGLSYKLFEEGLQIQARKLYDIQKKRLCPNERFNEILCEILGSRKDK